MKKIGAVFGLIFVASLAGAQEPTRTILEVKDASGSGQIYRDVLVSTDGSVTKVNGATTQVLKNLGESEVVAIENSVSLIQQAPLVRTNPNQYFNPGGFSREYILTTREGETFTFAKNVSGVDFGLAGSQGQDLVYLLNELDRLASVSH